MRAVSRRTVLALGLVVAAGLAVPVPRAEAAEIIVGDLRLEVPPDVVPADPTDPFGRNWQWRGRTDDSQLSPRGIVLARADLATFEPVEVLGLLLAGTAIRTAAPAAAVRSSEPGRRRQRADPDRALVRDRTGSPLRR